MLYTLMPQSERVRLGREYRLRVTVVLLTMASIAVLCGAVCLLPAYLRSRGAEQSALSKASSIKGSAAESSMDQADRALSSAASLISLISQSSGGQRFSNVVASIIDKRSSITISSLSLDRAAAGSVKVTIQGTAPTRDDLLAFKSRLESISPGASVDLPIAELAKDSDIQFSVALSLEQP